MCGKEMDEQSPRTATAECRHWVSWPQMRRRLLNLLTALSLVLCVAVVVSWLSARPGTEWTFHSASRRYTVRPQPGRLWVDVAEGQWVNGEFGAPRGKVYRLAARNRRQLPGRLEWVRNPASDSSEASWVWLFIPYWLLLAATTLLPTIWIVRGARQRFRRGREATLNRCPTCGYDLRATPDRCPECGAPASVSTPV
jgi:hypothetical protein